MRQALIILLHKPVSDEQLHKVEALIETSQTPELTKVMKLIAELMFATREDEPEREWQRENMALASCVHSILATDTGKKYMKSYEKKR